MRISEKSWQWTTVAALLLVLGLGAHFHFARLGWAVPGLLGHEFRQTQTALAIDAMRQDGFRLDYATPVLGKPWSIPMEFPLYQWLVVQVAERNGWPTAQAGRTVSLAAFYLGLPALWLLMRSAGASRARACLLLLSVLATPVYLFYTRTVLIESLAWTASAWFLACALRWWLNGSSGWLLGAWLTGMIASLVKGTTWAVFVVPLAVVLLGAVVQAKRGERVRQLWRELGRGAVLVLPPLLIGLAWVALADRIKAENPLAGFLESGNLATFNFGSVAERFSPAFWGEIVQHWCHTTMSWWALLIAGAALVAAPTRWRLVAGVALAGLCAGPLVFSNLYRVHDYYHYVTAGFLSLAAGMALLGLAEREGWRRGLGIAGFVALLAGQAQVYRETYFGVQTAPFLGTTPLTIAIEHVTLPDDVVVVNGSDWSSVVPYYSRRRALVIPDSQRLLQPAAVAANIRLLGDEHVSLVVFLGASRHEADLVARRVGEFALWPKPLFSIQDEADVYVAETDYLRIAEILRTDLLNVGLTVHRDGPAVRATPEVQEMGARRFAGSLRGFRPTPERGVLPFGYVLFNDNGRRVFVANVPTELDFVVPANARHVSLSYRVYEEAFTKSDFGGIRFLVELRQPGGAVVTLLDDWIDPDQPEQERGPRERVLALPGNAAGEVVFRTLPGPDGNAAFGWALLERFEIR